MTLETLAQMIISLQQEIQQLKQPGAGTFTGTITQPGTPASTLYDNTLNPSESQAAPITVPTSQPIPVPAFIGTTITRDIPIQAIIGSIEKYNHTEPQTLGAWLRQFQMKTTGCSNRERYQILSLCVQGKAVDMIAELQQHGLINERMEFSEIKTVVIDNCVPRGDHHKAKGEFLRRFQKPQETIQQYKQSLEELATVAYYDKSQGFTDEQILDKLTTTSLTYLQEHLCITRPTTIQGACAKREKKKICNRTARSLNQALTVHLQRSSH